MVGFSIGATTVSIVDVAVTILTKTATSVDENVKIMALVVTIKNKVFTIMASYM